MTTERRRQRRRPRLADVVADELRDEILEGAIADGDLLPKQDELIERFRVSPPSVREALRILETEGLVSVLRGNMGGAVVSQPQPLKVGYMLALVLQSRSVSMDDVAAALRGLEALCADLAARRRDRARTVVPALRARLDESVRHLDDTDAYIRCARAFHEDLVAGCGNETLVLMVGALEALWSAHVDHHTTATADAAPFASAKFRAASVRDHEAMIAAIAEGRAEDAAALVHQHFGQPDLHGFVSDETRVRANLLNPD
ncbi:MAG: FadR family transcriptional regulator [Acidimicrobiales bacterium]|nr:FadR family transcriptional regulator [Acidimicrobiales bacterium]